MARADRAGRTVITTADVLAERTAALERRADAYLVLPGGLGTRAELLSAWAGRRTGLHSRAIVVLDPDRSLHGLWLDVHQEIRAGRIPHGALGLLTTTTGAAAAVAHLIAATGQ